MNIDVLNVSRGSICVFRRSDVPSSMIPENATEEQIAEATGLYRTYYIHDNWSSPYECRSDSAA